MKVHIVVAAAFAFVIAAVPASAEEAKTYKLSLDQVTAISQALHSLDKPYQEQDPKDAAKQITKHFKFSVAVRVTMAKDLAEIDRIMTASAANRDQIISDVSNGTGEIKPNTPQYSQYLLKMNVIGRQQQDVSLVPISEADLDLADNPISFTTISALLPIMQEKSAK